MVQYISHVIAMTHNKQMDMLRYIENILASHAYTKWSMLNFLTKLPDINHIDQPTIQNHS